MSVNSFSQATILSAFIKFDTCRRQFPYLLLLISHLRNENIKSLNIFILKMENVVFCTFYEIYFCN